jgi:hypothetical protein
MRLIKIISFTIGFWFLVFVYANAQNLVPNPSFEDTVHCPNNQGQLAYSQNWITPTQGTPDYDNVCSTGNGGIAHVPNNGFGTQNAHTGNAYAGFYTYSKTYPNNDREYIQTNLTNPLTANHKYLVSLYVSLSEISQYAISSVGAYFSVSQITGTGFNILPNAPQIQNKASNSLADKTNWMIIEDTLTAQGGEQYITIGNFMKDSLSDTLYLGFSSSNNVAYYFIDDVSVIDVANIGIKQYAGGNMQVKVYPNPVNDILTIETSEEQGELKITDVLGSEIKNEKINKNLQIDVSGLSKGVYFITIVSGNKICTDKFVKE